MAFDASLFKNISSRNPALSYEQQQISGGALGLTRTGVRTVLFGDSMTDYYERAQSMTATYDANTGIVTVTNASAFESLPTGTFTRFWCNTYAETRIGRILPITYVANNKFTFVLADKPALEPTLTGTVFCKMGGVNQYVSWVGLSQMELGNPLHIVANLAQNGDHAANARRRLNDIFAYNPDLVIMQSLGLNDISANWGGAPFSDTDIIGNNNYLYKAITDRGIRLYVGLTTPVVTGEARGTKQNMQRILRINKATAEFARGVKGMRVFDFYRLIVSPTDTSGFATAINISPDKIHDAYVGGSKKSKLLKAAIIADFPSTPSTLPTTMLDYQEGDKLTVIGTTACVSEIVTVNVTGHGWKVGERFFAVRITQALANGRFEVLSVPDANSFTYRAPGLADGTLTGTLTFSKSNNSFINPMLATATGGTVSGTNLSGVAATGLTVSQRVGTATAVASVVALSASINDSGVGYGNAQQVVVSAAATNDQPQIGFAGSTSSALRMVPGRKYIVEALVSLKSSSWADTLIADVQSLMQLTWSTGEVWYLNVCNYNASPLTPTGDLLWHVKSSPLNATPPQVGATITAFDFVIAPRFTSAITNSATFTFAVGQYAVRDVTYTWPEATP